MVMRTVLGRAKLTRREEMEHGKACSARLIDLNILQHPHLHWCLLRLLDATTIVVIIIERHAVGWLPESLSATGYGPRLRAHV